MKKTLILLFSTFIATHLLAEVKMPSIFGNNMVLQRNRNVPVWGWADPNEKIVVELHGQRKSTIADKDGNWHIELDKEAAGGPFELRVSGKNQLLFQNVLIGEVWLCSGQSNMEMPIEGWGKVNNYEKEITEANFPQIRHIKIPNTISSVPLKDFPPAEWQVCSPSTAGEFTAAGYFFARELYNKLKVPIGLINSSWGGTHVETWTSREAFEASPEFKEMIAGMPSLNLDSLNHARTRSMETKIEALQGSLPQSTEAVHWESDTVNESGWPQMHLPSLWEQQQPGELDGVVWFRKSIDIPSSNAGKEATLELSMIDDNDITFVNGIKVGNTNSYNAPRKYTVPAGILKPGRNVIAVRVEDNGGGGGIYGDSADMRLTVNDLVLPLAGSWHYKVEKIYGSGIGPNSYPTLLFNAMINPLIPYAIEGAIWYQGESNAGRAYQYRKAFPLMIKDWRKRWNEGDFPFYFVQLASFNAADGNSNKGSTWAELREAQTLTLALPNTGMAVTTDIGNSNDIHPKDKQDVGKRLADIALHNVYHFNLPFSGPVFQSMTKKGDKIFVYFSHAENGLSVKGDTLKGFEIAGNDHIFYPASATVAGDHVIVRSRSVADPVTVRFGWKDDAGEDNLYNKDGFPAGPFRTDDWKGITEEQKFAIGDQ